MLYISLEKTLRPIKTAVWTGQVVQARDDLSRKNTECDRKPQNMWPKSTEYVAKRFEAELGAAVWFRHIEPRNMQEWY
jgi:hypothetical protein